MEKREAPLVNGESLTPEGSPERQPCLPPPPVPPTSPPAGRDETGRRKLSANSLAKGRSRSTSIDKGDLAQMGAGSRLEARIRRRTGLSRVGLLLALALLALLLIFLVVVIALAVTWPQTPHHHLFPVCTRAACLQASAQILPKMDSDASPCDDFWRYSCGGWLNEAAPPRPHWSPGDEQRLRYRERLRTLVTTLPFPTDPRRVQWKLQHLYESCMRLDSIESDGIRPLVKLVTELGGWSVLPDFSVLSWNSERTFVKLFSAQGITPFFHVGVIPDPKNTSKSIIKITPSGLDLPDKSYYYRKPDTPVPSAFMQYLRDIVTSFEARSTDARRFSDEMFYYQRRIVEILPEREQLDDPGLSNNRVTLDDLTSNAASVPLLDILQVMFPKASINKNTEVLVPPSKYLNQISNILSTSDRSPLNNYMMWVFASSYIPFLNREIREIENVYVRVLTGAEKPIERWEMCVTTLEKYMGIVLASLMEKEINTDERTSIKEEVNLMFDHIRDAVRSSIAKAYWFDKDLQELALRKINTMTVQIGMSSLLLDEDYLTRYYEGLQIQRSDFFKNIRNAREFELTLLDKKLMEPLEEYNWLNIAATGDEVSYVPTVNKVVIPQWLLHEPFYHPHFPMSVQYGGLGMQIASAIVSGVLPPDILYDADGSLIIDNSTLVNHVSGSVRRAKAYIIRDVVQEGLANEKLANRTSLNTVKHIAAIRQAYMALKEALTDMPHVHQPAMESYESDHLFFLTHAQNLCSKSTPQQMDIDFTTSQHLNGSQLISAILRQLPDFSQAFNCPATAVHYASNISPDIL